MMHGISMELFVEGSFAHGLATGDAETRKIWDAIGQYNRFFADNEDLYTLTKSMARLAIVIDNRSSNTGLLNALAARNVMYDVLYEDGLTTQKLGSYSAVALLTADTVRASALASLESFVNRGGKLITAGKAGTLDEMGATRAKPAFFAKGTYFEKLPPIDELAKALGDSSRAPVKLDAPAGVFYYALQQGDWVIVHLLSYTGRSTKGLKVSVEGEFRSVRLLSPDASREPAKLVSSGRVTQIEVPAVETYSVLLLEAR
jgi:hypothetical protein